MSFVGIIANPDAGNDIRRIVSQAVTVDNQQKLNIVARVLIALCQFGVARVEIMPNRFNIGQHVLDLLSAYPEVGKRTSLIDMPTNWTADDTLRAARYLRDAGATCIVVLGGDGTCRLVAKVCGDVPLVAISTGTNNVVPDFIEGTVAGLAAAYIATNPAFDRDALCWRHKKLLVRIADEIVDEALVDVTLVASPFVGSKAIWDVGLLRHLFVTRAQPSSTGMSAVIGMVEPVSPRSAHGAMVALNGQQQRVFVPLTPGSFNSVGIGTIEMLDPGTAYPLVNHQLSTIALDGEREIVLQPDQHADVILSLDGPWMVDVGKTLTQASKEGLFLDREGGNHGG